MGGGTFCVRGIAGIEGLPMEGNASRGCFDATARRAPLREARIGIIAHRSAP